MPGAARFVSGVFDCVGERDMVGFWPPACRRRFRSLVFSVSAFAGPGKQIRPADTTTLSAILSQTLTTRKDTHMASETLKPRENAIKVGDIVPNFELNDQTRTPWKLDEHLKKGDVVLCFFPFAFTGVCGTEMKCISKDLADWSKKGASVVGVSCDSPFVLKAWADAEGFKHTLLSDQHRQVTKALGLYWADMNTTQRGTVVIGKAADGHGKVKFVETRQPGNAMNWEQVLQTIA
jgi:peroxiredoxin